MDGWLRWQEGGWGEGGASLPPQSTWESGRADGEQTQRPGETSIAPWGRNLHA